MLIIDAHSHPDWWGYNRKKMLENMDSYNISAAWMLSLESPRDEFTSVDYPALHPSAYFNPEGAIPFMDCVKYAEANPDRFILGFCPDPRKPEAIDRFEAAIEMYDVRVCGECKFRMMYDAPDALDLFRVSGRYGLPVVLHMQTPIELGVKYPRRHDWFGGDIDTLERVLKKCPDTTFIGHAVAFWAGISGDDFGKGHLYPEGDIVPGGKTLELLRKYPNLYCDISANSGFNALNRDHVFAQEFIDEFQDKVIYARDLFGNQHQEFINTLNLPQKTLEKIFAKNAQGLIAKN